MVVFEGVNPTIFNFVSDLVGKLGVVLVGLAASFVYAVFMSWQVKSGKPIPVNVLGIVPRDFFEATKLARVLKWSLPGLLMALLFLATDFSHSIADLGLQFVALEKEGPYDTVLNLGVIIPSRLIETSGDPLDTYTVSVPKLAIEGDYALASVQWTLMGRFVDAVDQIARGGSPFLVDNRSDQSSHNTDAWGGFNYTKYTYNIDGSVLSQIDLDIPLNCTSSEMVPIAQQYITAQDEDPVATLVPNCTFDSRRPTGIYGGSRGTASVLEIARPVEEYDDKVYLTNGRDRFRDFVATPEMKRLARYRDDWRAGRVVSGIDGIQIGTLDKISLGAVVIATGEESTPLNYTLAGSVIWDRHSIYALVGEIVGGCPPRPSGTPTTGNSCFAIITLFCQKFDEDYAWPPGLIEDRNSDCYLEYAHLIWGEGFEQPDENMIPVMAGMYGRVRPNPFYLNAEMNFMLGGIFAAMFAVSTIETRPIIVEDVSPKINGVYIVFMLLPFVVLVFLVIAAVAARRSRLPIPLNPWEIMVVGSEEEEVKKRSNKSEDFTKPDRQLVYALRGDHQLGIVSLSEPIRSPSGPSNDALKTTGASPARSVEKTKTHPSVDWKSDENERESAPLDWNLSNAPFGDEEEAKKTTTADPSGIYMQPY